MSQLRVKTTWMEEGPYGSSIPTELYCLHLMSADTVTFYNAKGELQPMAFQSWYTDNDLWDAMNRLWFPFEDEWGGKLKEGVEYYGTPPWEKPQHRIVGPTMLGDTCPGCEAEGR